MEERLEFAGQLADSRKGPNLIIGAGKGLKQKVLELECKIEYEAKSAQIEMEQLKVDELEEEADHGPLFDSMRDDISKHFAKGKTELLHFFHKQNNENERFVAHIKNIRDEHLAFQQGIVSLQKRLKDLEAELGQ